jgi:hypothetical protein
VSGTADGSSTRYAVASPGGGERGVPATGDDVRAVGSFEGRARMPAWSADGTRLALRCAAGQPEKSFV